MDKLLSELREVCENKNIDQYHAWTKSDFYLENGVFRVKKYHGCSGNLFNLVCETCERCILNFPPIPIKEKPSNKYTQEELHARIKSIKTEIKKLTDELEQFDEF